MKTIDGRVLADEMVRYKSRARLEIVLNLSVVSYEVGFLQLNRKF